MSWIYDAYTNPVVSSPSIDVTSQLTSRPIQIKLAPINAPFFQHAKLLIAADCTAYAYANFHQEFMRNKVTLIGCPKLGWCGLFRKKLL